MGRKTVHFATASGSIQVNAPESTDIMSRPFHVSAETANYTIFSYKKTAVLAQDWTLVFNGLTDANKQAIQDFFYNSAEGPTNTFDYTHSDENGYTARFLDTQLQFQRRPNDWSLTVRLRVNTTEIT